MTPGEVLAQLQEIQKLIVTPIDRQEDLTPHLLYLTGLAQELSGEQEAAAETYLMLWKRYPDNAFSLMAYAKLEPVR